MTEQTCVADSCGRPERLRESVRLFRSAETSEAERDAIRQGWAAEGIPNQFAAMIRAAEMERGDG